MGFPARGAFFFNWFLVFFSNYKLGAQFIDSIGTALLSLTTDPTEEQILLEMVAKSFHAYNMAIPWIVKLISVEVAATSIHPSPFPLPFLLKFTKKIISKNFLFF